METCELRLDRRRVAADDERPVVPTGHPVEVALAAGQQYRCIPIGEDPAEVVPAHPQQPGVPHAEGEVAPFVYFIAAPVFGSEKVGAERR